VWPEPKLAQTHLGTIEYRDIGEGPAIVFLHLVLAEASHWDAMPPLLANGFRCIFPTLPMGAHRLPASEGADLTPDGLARAVSELLEHLAIEDATLVGNDSGGAIAQVVASTYPERLGRVVLTNCDMYDDFPPKLFAYFRLVPHIPGGMWLLGRTLNIEAIWPLPIAFGWLTHNIDGTKIHRWANALLASASVRRDACKVIKAFGPDVTNQAAQRLRTTKLPFLVAWGEDDRAFKISLAERFCAEVPSAELVRVKNSKTLVCWDAPERLAELIQQFISRAES